MGTNQRQKIQKHLDKASLVDAPILTKKESVSKQKRHRMIKACYHKNIRPYANNRFILSKELYNMKF